MDSQSLIKGFKAYLMLEKSLSQHSVDAYLRDVAKLDQFCKTEYPDSRLTDLDLKALESFIMYINELGLGARSQARIISGIKAFYKYCLIEDILADDPSELLEGPKLSRKIPDVLSYEEIELILSSIDLSHPQGTRNRAMLETLYACGLRVSELINLQLSHYHPEVGYVQVIGKGNKERIVPIGASAIKNIGYYLDNIRRHMVNIDPDHVDVLFLNRRGKRLSRVMVFMMIKELVKKAGLNKTVSPHTFRHSFATHLVEGGADLRAVQDMLGHESITTTEIYAHMDTAYLHETILMYHPRSKQSRESRGY